jgi:hypothetical protein
LARGSAGLAVAILAVVSIHAQDRPVPALLTGVPAAPGQFRTAGARPETVDAQTVTVNGAALAADVLDLALTGGVVVRAELDRRATLGGGAEVWSGHVPGAPMSSVTLVTVDGLLQGSVRTLDAAWSIEPSADATHVVRQIDAAALPRELPPLAPPPSLAALAANPPMAGDNGGTIDVLVLYTPGARSSAGGANPDATIQARIALGIAETNTGYANSGITPRLRLVGTQVLPYTEVGMSTDLSALQSNASVGTLRNTVGADLVSLIVANSAEACGVGYLLNGSSDWAFSVTSYHCISPNYSFGHELGHNMGSMHAPEDGGGVGRAAYSYGYKHPSNLFRTVMAYDCPVSCPRVLHFSNPDVNYAGAPTGTAAQHDNARSIDEAASTVANFRQSVGGNTAPTISAFGDVTIVEDGATGALSFTVGDAETAASSLTVTASSSNTTLVPNIAAALTLTGAGASRSLAVVPAANRFGTATITVTVSDGALSATRTFLLTVTAVNDPPVIARTPTAASVAAGSSAQTTVTVTDVDTAGSALALSTSSSNTTLLPNANIEVSVVTTAANSRTFLVTMTPAAGGAGAATVTINALDGGPAASTTFALTVSVLAPTVTTPAPQSTPEDTPVAVGFTVGDPDTPLAALTVQASSSNAAVVPAAGLAVSGAGASRTVTIAPAANATGSATITLTVGDGASTATTSFAVTVTPVNDPPLFAPGVPVSVSTLVSTPAAFQVTVSDPDTAGVSLTLAGVTTNAAVLANAGIAIAPLSSTAATRTFAVTLTPVAGATGSGGVSLTAGDAQASVLRAVLLSVTSTPGAPDAPTTLNATADGTTLHLTWTAPSTGSAPASYAVSIGTAPGTTTLPVQTTAATSLDVVVPASGVYFARVAAVNGYGTSLPSPEVEVTVSAPGRPGRTPRPRAWFSGRTLGMDWESPVGGDPVTNYLLEVGSAPGLANILVLPLSAARSFSASGVPDGTFWLRVRGSNSMGLGDPSEDVGLVMRPGGGCVGLPLAPVSLAQSVTGSLVSLSWNAPASGVAPTGYVLYAGMASGRTDLSVNTGAAPGWSGAAPPGIYYVRVAARTACGVGPLSNEVVVAVGAAATLAAPGPLSGTVSGRVVSLSWSGPSAGPAPSSYFLEVGSASGATDVAAFDTGSAATSIAGAVAPGRYFLRVRARAGAASGPASNEIEIVVP